MTEYGSFDPPLAAYDPDLDWAILNAGGTVKGACNVTSLEQHVQQFGYPDAFAGCSIGAEHLVLMSQGQVELLREMYEKVDGTGFFQRSNLVPWRWHRLWFNGGLFNFNPLHTLLQQYTDLDRNVIPPERCYFEMFDMERLKPVSLPKAALGSNEAYCRAALASSSQPLIHEYQRIKLPDYPRPVICVDGGAENVIPDLPEWWRYKNIRVLLNYPIERRVQVEAHDVDTWIEMAGRIFDQLMAQIAEKNMRRLQLWADYGVNVVVHAPGYDIGGSFDASPRTMARRLGPIGDSMWNNPVVL